MRTIQSPNVRWILVAGFFYSMASSIFWFSPTWLIYVLGGSNADLGLILGSATLVSIIFSLIASVIADNYRRDVLVWIGALVSVIGMFGLGFSFTLEQLAIFVLVTTIGNSIVQPSIAGLLADSVVAAKRNKVFGTQFLLNTSSGVIGNLLNYFLFLGLGNDISAIDPDLLRFSLLIGAGGAVIAFLLATMLRDKHSLSEQEEGSVSTSIASQSTSSQQVRWGFVPGALSILFITIVSGLFTGFGAGTSVPYFQRFFFDIYNLDLSGLSLVFAGLTLLTAVWGKINANLADRWGRVELIVANQLVAIALLYALATYPPLILALLALFVRNAVMNGAWPLNAAIQFEYTPRRFRSLVSAVTQIAFSLMFGLGQIFGGRLVDDVGFRLPFVITASLYLISTLIFAVIKPLESRIRNQH